VSCNEVDKQLFHLSIKVTIRNGQCAAFWESSWLEGQAPRNIASNLYKLAWRKNNSVAKDLGNQRWRGSGE
jgi:hypothetical protein